ncbi:MAG: hypothetical protein ACRDPY_47965 [Streptosporangiaceae bacterium]
MTNINSGVLPVQWLSRPGAFSLRSVGYLGTGMSGAGGGTGLCADVARAVPRVRTEVAFAASPAPAVAPMAQLGQTKLHNYMTSVNTNGEGAAGPPRGRKPA